MAGKTNVMRILEQKRIPYRAYTYPHEAGVAVDGISVAQLLGHRPETVFKTLVARGVSKTCYVFVIPVAAHLDLRKAAACVGEKTVEMVSVAELQILTGYVRGGCSPVGMKKKLHTVFHSSAGDIAAIVVSAGKIGYQVELDSRALMALTEGKTADLVTE